MSSPTYIIEMPGKPPREVTNINFLAVSQKVLELGGKIYPKPEPPKETQNHFQSTLTTKPDDTNKTSYNWNEVFEISQFIAKKYFSDCDKVLNCQVTINYRLKRCLGLARHKRNRMTGTLVTNVELSRRVVNGDWSHKLHQVIFHEFVHVQYPLEGHTGLNFRYKEKNNPYREKRTNRLSCVS